jgi:hypothetical protein
LSAATQSNDDTTTVKASALTTILGITFLNPGFFATIGIFDSGLLNIGRIGLAAINPLSATLITNANSPGSLERLDNWNTLTGANSAYGNFLVRTSTIDAPATVAILGLGLAGLGFSRRRKTA